MIIAWSITNQAWLLLGHADVATAPLVDLDGKRFWATRRELEDDLRRHGLRIDVPSHRSAIQGARVVPEHTADSDCTVDPATNLCEVCGVEHGDPCRCGGRAFHSPGCPDAGQPVPAYRERSRFEEIS